MADGVGRPPSSRSRLLARSREALSPDRSLEALGEASGRIVSGVSVAAALTSALTLGGAVGVAGVGWGWAAPGVVLGATAVVLAIWAAIPRSDQIRPGDLEDVDRFFSEQLGYRARLLRLSGVALCLALAAIPLPFIAASVEVEVPSVGLTVQLHGRRVTVEATVERAGRGQELVVSVVANGHRRAVGRGRPTNEGRIVVITSPPPDVELSGGPVSAQLLDGRRVVAAAAVPPTVPPPKPSPPRDRAAKES